MGLTKIFMFLAVWGLLATTSNARAEIIIGGEDDIGDIGDLGGDDSGFEEGFGEDEGGPDCNEGPDDKFESPPMTGGGTINLLGIHDRRPIACFARNARGDVFEALGADRRLVQDRAMRKCDRVSRICRPLGCHRLM